MCPHCHGIMSPLHLVKQHCSSWCRFTDLVIRLYNQRPAWMDAATMRSERISLEVKVAVHACSGNRLILPGAILKCCLVRIRHITTIIFSITRSAAAANLSRARNCCRHRYRPVHILHHLVNVAAETELMAAQNMMVCSDMQQEDSCRMEVGNLGPVWKRCGNGTSHVCSQTVITVHHVLRFSTLTGLRLRLRFVQRLEAVADHTRPDVYCSEASHQPARVSSQRYGVRGPSHEDFRCRVMLIANGSCSIRFPA